MFVIVTEQRRWLTQAVELQRLRPASVPHYLQSEDLQTEIVTHHRSFHMNNLQAVCSRGSHVLRLWHRNLLLLAEKETRFIQKGISCLLE